MTLGKKIESTAFFSDLSQHWELTSQLFSKTSSLAARDSI